jgi:hypothetical protein
MKATSPFTAGALHKKLARGHDAIIMHRPKGACTLMKDNLPTCGYARCRCPQGMMVLLGESVDCKACFLDGNKICTYPISAEIASISMHGLNLGSFSRYVLARFRKSDAAHRRYAF